MNDETNNSTTNLANIWAGRNVRIRGFGGTMYIDPQNPSLVRTGFSDRPCRIVLERAPENMGLPGAVAFRVEGSQKYLTNIMYGDNNRQNVAKALASIPALLPDHIPLIVDFAVGKSTGSQNFEGVGFNYSPMLLQDGPPNKLQLFELEQVQYSSKLGVRSLFGTYWRSQHWNKTVSQSSHLLGDESWHFIQC